MAKIILTIDDMPQENTPALVDWLSAMEIPAVFFAVGENLEKHPEIAIYALQKGFLIGNHSYSHPAFSAISLEEGIREITRTEVILDQIYREAGVKREHKIFRFPYIDKGGVFRGAYQDYLRKAGFSKLVDSGIEAPGYLSQGMHRDMDTACSFDCQEYNIPPGALTIQDVLRRIEEGDPGMGSSVTDESEQIVLLHSHDDTERCVPEYYRLILGKMLEFGAVFMRPMFISG
ncbi:MAG: polysaccharide deacetylase family protein [Eubacterium sp.]|nr:polysaccharide deacetylase family protein [Eubacterium sp.]